MCVTFTHHIRYNMHDNVLNVLTNYILIYIYILYIYNIHHAYMYIILTKSTIDFLTLLSQPMTTNLIFSRDLAAVQGNPTYNHNNNNVSFRKIQCVYSCVFGCCVVLHVCFVTYIMIICVLYYIYIYLLMMKFYLISQKNRLCKSILEL